MPLPGRTIFFVGGSDLGNAKLDIVPFVSEPNSTYASTARNLSSFVF